MNKHLKRLEKEKENNKKIYGKTFDFIIYDEADYIKDEDWQKIMTVKKKDWPDYEI